VVFFFFPHCRPAFSPMPATLLHRRGDVDGEVA
jgi:hypothetical protein